METKTEYKIAAWPAMVNAKCPRCRRGNMFANSMYGFSGQKMLTSCPHCGLVYEREPGYFYVAMFASYALNVAEMVTIAVAIHVLTGSDNPWLYVTLILAAAFILAPFNFRYSRVMLMYWLTPGLHYHPEMSRDKTDEQ